MGRPVLIGVSGVRGNNSTASPWMIGMDIIGWELVMLFVFARLGLSQDVMRKTSTSLKTLHSSRRRMPSGVIGGVAIALVPV